MSRLAWVLVTKLEFHNAIGYPNLWERETEYDKYEQAWFVWFECGLDSWLVVVYQEDGQYFLDEIINVNALDEAEQAAVARDQAIELAFEASDIKQALAGVDNWRTYVEPQGK